MIPPVTASPLATYRAHLARHELAYQFSPQAGKAVFFPRLVCPYTGTTELEWRVSQGRGEVHATTVVFPRDAEPYNVALIALDEGFRMMSRVEGQSPQSVTIGQKVRVAFVLEAGETVPLPVFVADGENQHG
ncbi:OB-fold domain-containing protein [Acidovorax sp. CCYZU-2555]|uniref:Zn-ribbon domain-containing OB-fold protein n=1 Tax=Acidovorax sp. CCYZU-2555 TaxID=2835042 RepID=UPI001BCEA4D9|nr:OB-fold domain-containing protein [Acidovorax sp. CCYZU-2555]MBS7780668.1 OB-fold domain-containing protein [Acidovorax sp. CCYZU-2555]